MKPTLRDVAARAGVSFKTVSRVVNGESGVTPAKTRAVRDAIAELNYHPNRAARALRTGASDFIGVLVDSLSDPFFAKIVAVVERRALERRLDVLVASTGADAEWAATQVSRLCRRNPAGLIVTPIGQACVDALDERIPTVLIDRVDGGSAYDSVSVTDYQGAVAALEHLLDEGHSRIGFVGESLRFSTVRNRLRGYRETLHLRGVTVDEAWVDASSWRTADAAVATERLLRLDPPLTAVFASTPMAGEGALWAIRKTQRQVSLVVFGDFPLADLMVPPVTVVDQHPSGLAEAAMDLLFDRIDGSGGPPVQKVLPTRMIIRESGRMPEAH